MFHTAGPCGCGLHAWGGADAKPVACRQFPWIAVHDPRGTFASLSHVVQRRRIGSSIRRCWCWRRYRAPRRRFDGLDVRRSLPPALSPRRLLDWDALSAWEAQALDACARNDAPEDVLQDLLALRTHARRWTTTQGPLAAWIASWTPDAPPSAAATWRPDPALDAIVRASAPVGLAVPPPVACGTRPRWRAGAPLIRRYLAARLIACWPLHYGTGVATAIAYAAALLSVLAAKIARRAPAGPRPPGAAVLAAIAETNRLVVHLAAPTRWPAGSTRGPSATSTATYNDAATMRRPSAVRVGRSCCSRRRGSPPARRRRPRRSPRRRWESAAARAHRLRARSPALSNPDLVNVFTSRGLDAREEDDGVVIYLPTVYLFEFGKSDVDARRARSWRRSPPCSPSRCSPAAASPSKATPTASAPANTTRR